MPLYIAADLQAEASLHPEKQTVDYTVTVTPGDLYHMGTLQLENLTAAQQAEVLSAWKLKEGGLYDASYTQFFLRSNSRRLRSLDGYSASYKQYIHHDTHIVDLIVTFKKDGSLN